MRRKDAAALIKALDRSADSQSAPVEIVSGGSWQGTYVVKELVYAYAMWISPEFNLRVIRASDALVTRPQVPAVLNLRDPMQLAAAAMQFIEMNQEPQGKVGTMRVGAALRLVAFLTPSV